MRKLMRAAVLAASLGLLALPVAQAAAKVTVSFNIGVDLSGGRRISCMEGKRGIERHGFERVHPIDCQGRFYVYRVWHYRDHYEIVLRASNGRVADYRYLR